MKKETDRMCQNVIIVKSPHSCALLRRTSYVYVKNLVPHAFAIHFSNLSIVQLCFSLHFAYVVLFLVVTHSTCVYAFGKLSKQFLSLSFAVFYLYLTLCTSRLHTPENLNVPQYYAHTYIYTMANQFPRT